MRFHYERFKLRILRGCAEFAGTQQTEKRHIYVFVLWHGSIVLSLVALQPVDSASDGLVVVSPASMLSPCVGHQHFSTQALDRLILFLIESLLR